MKLNEVVEIVEQLKGCGFKFEAAPLENNVAFVELEKIATKGMEFETALFLLKKGYKVARRGWNGKGMFLYYVPANSYPAQTEAAKEHFGDMVDYGAYIAMKTAQGNVVPWLASQTDVLAEDWEIIK
ncbi:DUF2829 domain-containing protein [Bacillus swezeyi]|uniref:DUF2829 domain-containing protein n=1 Tax=Bacillus swezeyi TaxID=1925020 RepID=UPI0027DD47A5|nr:DUF2829 domain-containing protein [Bacillus swezeyi]